MAEITDLVFELDKNSPLDKIINLIYVKYTKLNHILNNIKYYNNKIIIDFTKCIDGNSYHVANVSAKFMDNVKFEFFNNRYNINNITLFIKKQLNTQKFDNKYIKSKNLIFDIVNNISYKYKQETLPVNLKNLNNFLKLRNNEFTELETTLLSNIHVRRDITFSNIQKILNYKNIDIDNYLDSYIYEKYIDLFTYFEDMNNCNCDLKYSNFIIIFNKHINFYWCSNLLFSTPNIRKYKYIHNTTLDLYFKLLEYHDAYEKLRVLHDKFLLESLC